MFHKNKHLAGIEESAIPEVLSSVISEEISMNQTQTQTTIKGATTAVANELPTFDLSKLSASLQWVTWDVTSKTWREAVEGETPRAIILNPGMSESPATATQQRPDVVREMLSAFAAVAGQHRYAVIQPGVAIYNKPENDTLGGQNIGVITEDYDGQPFSYHGMVAKNIPTPETGTVRALYAQFGNIRPGKIYSFANADNPELPWDLRQKNSNFVLKHLCIGKLFVEGIRQVLILGPRTLPYAVKVVENLNKTPEEAAAAYQQMASDKRFEAGIKKAVKAQVEAVEGADPTFFVFGKKGEKVDVMSYDPGTWLAVTRNEDSEACILPLMVGNSTAQYLAQLATRFGREAMAVRPLHNR